MSAQRDYRHDNGIARNLTTDQRFWSKVKRTATCWIWQACTDPKGYGLFYVDRTRTVRAHTFAFELVNGRPVLDGMCLDHLCRVPGCVNPSHLEEVTYKTNMRRGVAPGAIALRRDQCRLGHDFTTWGTYRQQRRVCRLCSAAYMRSYNQTGTPPTDLAASVAEYIAEGHHLILIRKPAPGVPAEHHAEAVPEVGGAA